MEKNQVKAATISLVVVTFLIMVVVNALANALPINGRTTGQISELYGNLFTPAAYTFAIWGLIYVLLACYTLYQLGLFQKREGRASIQLMEKVGGYFAISSVANAAWIFAWHYDQIALSLLCMLIILVCLILINQAIKHVQLGARELFFIRLPFSVYFGWITVATIANVTTLLVGLGWNGFGISEQTWTILILTVGMLIAAATIIRNRDVAYGLVPIWAYLGILIKHTSAGGWAGQYPAVIVTVVVSIILLILAVAGAVVFRRKERRT